MRSLECRSTRREIDEMELGERPSEQATSHLATCAACREFRAERTMLRELAGSLEPVAAPADFDMRLHARIAAERSSDRRQPFFARLLTTPALATAALFVVAAGAAVWIAQRQPSAPVPNNQAATNVPTTATSKQDTSAGAEVTTPSAGAELVADRGRNSIRRPRNIRSTRSEDFSSMPANAIRQDDRAYVPSRPVEFSVQDERGNTRKISLPAVSFGAQSLVDNRTAVSYSPNSRVW
jgi:hypothetical protein